MKEVTWVKTFENNIDNVFADIVQLLLEKTPPYTIGV